MTALRAAGSICVYVSLYTLMRYTDPGLKLKSFDKRSPYPGKEGRLLIYSVICFSVLVFLLPEWATTEPRWFSMVVIWLCTSCLERYLISRKVCRESPEGMGGVRELALLDSVPEIEITVQLEEELEELSRIVAPRTTIPDPSAAAYEAELRRNLESTAHINGHISLQEAPHYVQTPQQELLGRQFSEPDRRPEPPRHTTIRRDTPAPSGSREEGLTGWTSLDFHRRHPAAHDWLMRGIFSVDMPDAYIASYTRTLRADLHCREVCFGRRITLEEAEEYASRLRRRIRATISRSGPVDTLSRELRENAAYWELRPRNRANDQFEEWLSEDQLLELRDPPPLYTERGEGPPVYVRSLACDVGRLESMDGRQWTEGAASCSGGCIPWDIQNGILR